MVLPISMFVYEIQCGSLVHFCMVNLGYKKSGHRSNLVLRLAHRAMASKRPVSSFKATSLPHRCVGVAPSMAAARCVQAG